MVSYVVDVKECIAKESGRAFKVVTLRLENGFAGRLACFNGEADKLVKDDLVNLEITTDFRNNVCVRISD